MIYNVLRWCLPIVAAVGIAGCIDMEKLVHVKPDGSGFVEERMLMTREALRMMQGMARTAAQPGDDAGFQLLDKDRLATQAVAMGPGVTLISAEALSTPEGEGYVARFAFTDINRLTLDQNPNQPASGDAAQAGPPGVETAPDTVREIRAAGADAGADTGADTDEAPGRKMEAIRFDLRKGDQPVLIIRSPRDAKAPPGDITAAEETLATRPDGAEKPMAVQMMQQMFKGMHVAVRVEVDGEIIETNAGFRDGSRVTLMDIRFDQILADPERFERLVLAQPQGIGQVKALMKDLPGVTVELNDPVQIRFKPR
jgi:hypothetical protein